MTARTERLLLLDGWREDEMGVWASRMGEQVVPLFEGQIGFYESEDCDLPDAVYSSEEEMIADLGLDSPDSPPRGKGE